MNTFFYPRLAAQNIRKNGKFYYPYILTVIGTVAAFYIFCALAGAKDLPQMSRYAYLSAFMSIGVFVAGIFSVIFLFYTNSFLIKRRKKELGLYNVLGMDKKNIAVMLGFESLYLGAIGIGGGLLAGILLQKLVTMFVCRMMGYTGGFRFYISWEGIVASLVLFGVILLLTYLHDLRTIRLQKPVELLHGGNVGEKEPKTKWLLTVFGILMLGGGYAIALLTKNPVDALTVYFLAVILVILGTYCLFTAVSITVLKLLRKNKRFYYKTGNFIGISGMLYRMKRNAVGLANISILSCMVLVMISATLSLYAGTEDSLNRRCPADLMAEVNYEIGSDSFDASVMEQKFTQAVKNNGRTVTSSRAFSYLGVAFGDTGSVFTTNRNQAGNISSTASVFCFMTADSYAKLTGEKAPALSDGEVLLYVKGIQKDSLTFEFSDEATGGVRGTLSYRVKENLKTPVEVSQYASYITRVYYVVLPDEAALDEVNRLQSAVYGDSASLARWNLLLGVDGTGEEQSALAEKISDASYIGYDSETDGLWRSYYVNSRASESLEIYAMNGGFFFLGIFLGLLFIMATVLIIYYKQVSEGYEDRERFQIMQKVGLPKEEIRKSVSGQILTVFFMPLLVAAVHVAFDFPIMNVLLTLFQLSNVGLTLLCTGATFLLFVIIYVLIYFLTARVYYKIVE